MFSALDWSARQAAAALLLGALLAWFSVRVRNALYNVRYHPLSKFPGPRAAAASKLWKAYIECVKQESFCQALERLHAQYGMYIAPSCMEFPEGFYASSARPGLAY